MGQNILTATEFKGIIPKGGSTKPWVVEATDPEGNAELYVVKMFTPKQIEQQNAVSKEVFGNVLAAALGLPAPDFAYIRFGTSFLETLTDEFRQIVESSHKGLRFGSRFAAGYTIFDDALSTVDFNPIDMANVYAFDNLVRNLDRGGFRKKPNLLVNNNNFLLIDHEQIFPFADDPENYNDVPIRNFQQGVWMYPFQVHLFYPYLRERPEAEKSTIFNNFVERLNAFDPFILEEYAQFLKDNAQPVGNLELILDYLSAVKRAPNNFAALLQTQLS